MRLFATVIMIAIATSVVAGTRLANGQMPEYAINGVTRSPKSGESLVAQGDEAKRFVQQLQGGVEKAEDDSFKHWLSIIGTQEELDRVKADINGNGILGAMKVRDSFHVGYYSPEQWQVTGVKLGTGGKPDIVIQSPADSRGIGRVVYRQRDYSGGPGRLARGIQSIGAGAVRQPNPDYDPNKDPGISGVCPLGFGPEHWSLIGATALLLIAFVFYPRKPST